MALSVGAFRATLGLDTSGYASGILNAQSLTSVFGETVTNIVNNPLTGMIGLLKDAAGAAIRTAGDTLDYAETISRIADNANVAAETLQVLRELLEDEGLAADGATAAIEKFNLRLGDLRRDGGPAKDALKDLKIDVDALSDGDTALRTIIEAIARTEDSTVRASLAADLFDKQFGSKIVEAVRRAGGSIENLRRQFGGLILDDRTLGNLGQLDDTLDSLSNVSDALARAAPAAILSGFAEAFGGLNSIDIESPQQAIAKLTPKLEELGKALGTIAREIKEIASSAGGLTTAIKVIDATISYGPAFAAIAGGAQGAGISLAATVQNPFGKSRRERQEIAAGFFEGYRRTTVR